MLTVTPGPFTLEGLEIGCVERLDGPTGCTALVFREGACAACFIGGGAPGTREASALDPISLIPRVHGLVLTGGSAFGLDAAAGVMRWLEERGIGFPTSAGVIPIVPGAVIFDLAVGDPRVRPDAALGYEAAAQASAAGGAEGNRGAGAGATVGKVLGHQHAMKGGQGMASIRLGSGHFIGALAVVNAFGDVADPATGQIIAGARDPSGQGFADTTAILAIGATLRPYLARGAAGGTTAKGAAEVATETGGSEADRGEAEAGPPGGAAAPPTPPAPPAPSTPPAPPAIENTTLVAIVTDVPLGKPGLGRVARMAHDGFARALRPCHTQWDGDIAYAFSTAPDPDPHMDGSAVGAVAAEVVACAILRAVTESAAIAGYPSVRG